MAPTPAEAAAAKRLEAEKKKEEAKAEMAAKAAAKAAMAATTAAGAPKGGRSFRARARASAAAPSEPAEAEVAAGLPAVSDAASDAAPAKRGVGRPRKSRSADRAWEEKPAEDNTPKDNEMWPTPRESALRPRGVRSRSRSAKITWADQKEQAGTATAAASDGGASGAAAGADVDGSSGCVAGSGGTAEISLEDLEQAFLEPDQRKPAAEAASSGAASSGGNPATAARAPVRRSDEELVAGLAAGKFYVAPASLPALGGPAPSMQICRQCKAPMDVLARGARLMSKVREEWVCARCNAKVSGLQAIFGQWPLDCFRKLDDTEKNAFWGTCGESRGDLRDAIERLLITQKRRLLEETVGTYLPLQAWVNKGWDREAVLKCPNELHKQTGVMTYAVNVHSMTTQNIRDLARQEVLELAQQGKAKGRHGASPSPAPSPAQAITGPIAGDPPPKRGRRAARSASRGPEEEEEEEEEEEGNEEEPHGRGRSAKRSPRSRRRDSRSRSRDRRRRRSSRHSRSRSRSRSGRRGRSRSKDAKKREAAREAERKKRQRAAEVAQAKAAAVEKKRVATLVSDGTRIVNKLGSLATEYQTLEASKAITMLPGQIKAKFDKWNGRINDMMAAARSRVSGSSKEAFDFQIADVAEAYTEGSSCCVHPLLMFAKFPKKNRNAIVSCIFKTICMNSNTMQRHRFF